MIFKLFLVAAMGFFGYVIVKILKSDLTNGEKLVSLAVFLLLEILFFFSLVTL
jgi:hypothetical protein